jgi:integrase
MGTVVRVKGIKRYRHPETGIWYCYHRKTGKPIAAEFGSPEFFVELAAIDRAAEAAKPVPGSLGLIIEEYRRSPDWATLRPKTRLSYDRAFAVLHPLKEMPLVRMDRPFIFALRDKKILPKHGTWLANYTVTVLTLVLRFAQDRGWLKSNPLAERVKKIKVPRDDRAGNRPWSEEECQIVIDRAPPHLRLPLGLAMCAGFRKADFLTVTMGALKGGMISVRTSKRGVPVTIPIHPILADAIATRPNSNAVQLAVNSYGEPWTETGFNASFRTFKKGLEQEGLIAPGLTPHGLRHTLGTRLREAGADDRTIADILGQKSTSMARHYSENAALPEQAKGLMAGLNLTGRRNKS